MFHRPDNMTLRRGCIAFAAATALAPACICRGQAASPAVAVKVIAEVESSTEQQGHQVTHLVAADRVVPGDHVIYTLAVRNTGTEPVPAPTVTNPIPAHMQYVADSAVGPGAEVSYSVDGGLSFDKPENLQVPTPDGRRRAAVPADYTHIRWQLKNVLKGNSVAFVRFRAVVK